jgi:mannose-6-phosphate isomerase-like protein (cupin superfamily)
MKATTIVEAGEGVPINGGRGRIKAGADQTEGSLAIIENLIVPGRWIAPHVHANEEEAWYVLEGTMTFRFDDATHVAPAGSFVLVPRGIAHSFGNDSEVPARFLEFFAPAGMEGYFLERESLAQTSPGNDYAGIDPQAHAALARRHGMTFV